MKETWKCIPALSVNRRIGYFEASSQGRIREQDTERIIKTIKTSKVGIELALLPQKHRRPVHQLVLHAFKGLKPHDGNNYRAKHLDDDYANNTPENLDWVKIPTEET